MINPLHFAYGQTITVHRPAPTDNYGDPIGPAPAPIPVPGCAVAPQSTRSSSELTDRRTTVTTPVTLYAPHDADIRATDVVELADGTRWHVDGEPGQWSSPFSAWAPGLEITLQKVTG